MAGVFNVVGDVVELVDNDGQLQQRNGQQREPRNTSAPE